MECDCLWVHHNCQQNIEWEVCSYAADLTLGREWSSDDYGALSRVICLTFATAVVNRIARFEFVHCMFIVVMLFLFNYF